MATWKRNILIQNFTWSNIHVWNHNTWTKVLGHKTYIIHLYYLIVVELLTYIGQFTFLLLKWSHHLPLKLILEDLSHSSFLRSKKMVSSRFHHDRCFRRHGALAISLNIKLSFPCHHPPQNQACVAVNILCILAVCVVCWHLLWYNVVVFVATHDGSKDSDSIEDKQPHVKMVSLVSKT